MTFVSTFRQSEMPQLFLPVTLSLINCDSVRSSFEEWFGPHILYWWGYENVFLFLNWSPILLLECKCPAEFCSSKLTWVSIYINMDTFKNRFFFFSLCFGLPPTPRQHFSPELFADTLQSGTFLKSSFRIVVWKRRYSKIIMHINHVTHIAPIVHTVYMFLPTCLLCTMFQCRWETFEFYFKMLVWTAYFC